MLSFLFYIFVFVWSSLIYVVTFIALPVCYPFDKKRYIIHTFSGWITHTVFGLSPWMKREVIGIENIDPNERYVITFNHNSMVDILTPYKIPLVFKWVSKREVYKIPMVGRLLYMHGDIVINRSSPKEAMQFVHTKGMAWLKKGASVSIFPEGTRSKDGEIHNFKAGAFILAKDAGVPILPVVVEGTDTMRRKGSPWMNWRNRVTIKVLPPVSKERVAEASIKEVMAEVHETMVNTLAELRREKNNK